MTNLVLNIVRKIFCLPPDKLYVIPENPLSKVKNNILITELKVLTGNVKFDCNSVRTSPLTVMGVNK